MYRCKLNFYIFYRNPFIFPVRTILYLENFSCFENVKIRLIIFENIEKKKRTIVYRYESRNTINATLPHRSRLSSLVSLHGARTQMALENERARRAEARHKREPPLFQLRRVPETQTIRETKFVGHIYTSRICIHVPHVVRMKYSTFFKMQSNFFPF